MAISVLSGLILPPLLISSLGTERYSIWVLVGQIICYFAILDFGVSSSIGRFVAKYNANKDFESTESVVNSAIFMFMISTVLIIIIVMFLWPNFPSIFHLDAKYSKIGKWLVIITGLGVAVNFPLKIGQGLLEGTHNFHIIYFTRISGTLFKIILICLFFGFFKYTNLLLLALVTLAATTITNFFMCISGFFKSKNLSLNFKKINFLNIKEIWSLSFCSLLITLSSLLINQGQVIAVGRLADAKHIVIYSIPVMFLTYASMTLGYIVAAFVPLASHMQALEGKEQLKKLNIEGVNLLFIFSLFIALLTITFGEDFLRIWLAASNLQSEDFSRMSLILMIMVSGFAIGSPQFVTAKVLSGTNRHKMVAAVSLISSIIGLSTGILLMLKTQMSIFGMAVGWASVFLIQGIMIYPVSACKIFEFKFWDYINKTYVRCLLPASILFLFGLVINHFFDIKSVLSLLGFTGLYASIYAFLVYFLTFNQEQKLIIKNLIIGFRNKF